MSGPEQCPPPRGRGRILAVGTSALTVAAAGVLAVGANDIRLLKLGLVAALWAALLGAFTAARLRREISSGADRVDQLRTVYQLELECEVAARQEHALTVELELREQHEQAERREIETLHAELAAVRANLEKLIGRDASVDRVAQVDRVALGTESARLVPLPTHVRKGDGGAAVQPKATRGLSVAGSSVRAQGNAGPPSQHLPGPSHFGPRRPHQATLDSQPLTVSNAQPTGRHGSSSREPSGSNGSPETAAQRTVDDLLAAYGGAPRSSRRRRGRGNS